MCVENNNSIHRPNTGAGQTDMLKRQYIVQLLCIQVPVDYILSEKSNLKAMVVIIDSRGGGIDSNASDSGKQ